MSIFAISVTIMIMNGVTVMEGNGRTKHTAQDAKLMTGDVKEEMPTNHQESTSVALRKKSNYRPFLHSSKQQIQPLKSKEIFAHNHKEREIDKMLKTSASEETLREHNTMSNKIALRVKVVSKAQVLRQVTSMNMKVSTMSLLTKLTVSIPRIF